MWEDWGKLIVAKGFKKLPKVQNIAQSGHTGCGSVAKAVACYTRGPQFVSASNIGFISTVE